MLLEAIVNSAIPQAYYNKIAGIKSLQLKLVQGSGEVH